MGTDPRYAAARVKRGDKEGDSHEWTRIFTTDFTDLRGFVLPQMKITRIVDKQRPQCYKFERDKQVGKSFS